MRANGLVQTMIEVGGFVLEDVTVNARMNEINLAIRSTKLEQFWCGICHRKATRYDKDRVWRRWCCLDVGTQKEAGKNAEKPPLCLAQKSRTSV